MNFPNESAAYRAARERLLELEIEVRRQEEAAAVLRRALPLGGEVPEDYEFAGVSGPVRLSELFEAGKDTLFLYNFMFLPDESGVPLQRACPACTSIIDALDGSSQHLVQQINFVVVAKVPFEQFSAHAKSRGWRHARLLSSAPNTFNRTYFAENESGAQWPIAHVFVRRDGKVHHFWSSELFGAPTEPGQHPRHVDFMWPVWSVLDRTPGGRGADWEPRLEYDG